MQKARFGPVLQQLKKGGRGVEIGVCMGWSASFLLGALNPTEFFLIDPFSQDSFEKVWKTEKMVDKPSTAYDFVIERFAPYIEKGIVKVCREFSYDIVNKFEYASLDWVYVDGDHTYHGTKTDLDLYFPKIKMGGFLLGDDYDHIEHSCYGTWDVKGAVTDFISENPTAQLVALYECADGKSKTYYIQKIA